ncbi:hypothetical protein KCP69_19520 [Salmonella enterica subsp. enterica]|nr:hypothetical protein KCP69_19520 [Salmonella enterica subsp. enterica]
MTFLMLLCSGWYLSLPGAALSPGRVADGVCEKLEDLLKASRWSLLKTANWRGKNPRSA